MADWGERRRRHHRRRRPIALQHQWIGDAGLCQPLSQFQHLDLPAWDRFVVGGHEIRGVRLVDEAGRLAAEMRAAARS